MTERPRQFLPGVWGADIPITPVTPQNATPGNGPLAGQTSYFDLNLVNFGWITWHDYEWENWIQVDALLNAAIGFLNLRGIWRPTTDYVAGQTVLDPRDTLKYFTCLQDHTSSTDPAQLDDTNLWEQKTAATPPVESVFGRIGQVTAQVGDYEAFYLKLTGGTLAGPLTMDGGNLRIRNTRTLQFFNAGGTDTTQAQLEAGSTFMSARVFNASGLSPTVYRMRNAAASPSADDVLRRSEIDALISTLSSDVAQNFLRLTGGTLTGPLEIQNTLNVTGAGTIGGQLSANSTSSTSAFIIRRGESNTRFWSFGSTSGTDDALRLFRNDSGLAEVARFEQQGPNAAAAQTVMTREKGDARYLQLTGGTLTGPLAVTGFVEATGQIRAYLDGTNALVWKRNNVEWQQGLLAAGGALAIGQAGALVARFDPAGTTSPDVLTIQTREKADARYVRLTGGSGQTMEGTLVIEADPTNALTNLQLRARTSDNIQEVSFRKDDGSGTDRWDIRVQHNAGNPLLTFRPNGVTTASFFGSGFASFTGAVQAVGLVNLSGDTQQRTDLNPSVSFRNAAGTINSLLYLNRAGETPTWAGRLTVNAYAPDGSGGRIVGQFEDRIQDGGVLAGPQSIITREHGDARYGQRYESVGNNQTVFQGDLDTLFGPNASTVYFCNTSATNAPENVNGHLFVETHPTNGNFAAQRFVENGGASRVWVRTRASGVWGAWQELSSTAPTFGEIAAANLPTGSVSADILGIPAWANHIEVLVSLMGGSAGGSINLRVGNATGWLTTGYSSVAQQLVTTPTITGTVQDTLFTFAWGLNSANSYSGKLKLTRYSENIWMFDAQGFDGPGNMYVASGRVNAGDVIDRIQLRLGTGTIERGGAGVRFWR